MSIDPHIRRFRMGCLYPTFETLERLIARMHDPVVADMANILVSLDDTRHPDLHVLHHLPSSVVIR